MKFGPEAMIIDNRHHETSYKRNLPTVSRLVNANCNLEPSTEKQYQTAAVRCLLLFFNGVLKS